MIDGYIDLAGAIFSQAAYDFKKAYREYYKFYNYSQLLKRVTNRLIDVYSFYHSKYAAQISFGYNLIAWEQLLNECEGRYNNIPHEVYFKQYKKRSTIVKEPKAEPVEKMRVYNVTKVKCLDNGITYACAEQAARALKINRQGIYRVCLGMQNSTKGYHFKYV